MKTRRDLLVIDDEPVVLQSIVRTCESEGITVDTAPGGRPGLERLEQANYRLVICDLMMGDLNGFEFLTEASRRGHRTPVVMTTGNATVQNAVRSLQGGAIDCLPKPFTADELIAVVRRGMNFEALRTDGLPSTPALNRCPEDVHRLGHLSWARIEPVGTVLIGAQPLFVETVQGIQALELAAEETELVLGTGCATFFATDGLAHELMCPVSGHVIEPNPEITTHLSTLETDPYGAGWLYRILPSDLGYCLKFLTTGAESPAPPPLNRKGESP